MKVSEDIVELIKEKLLNFQSQVHGDDLEYNAVILASDIVYMVVEDLEEEIYKQQMELDIL